MTGGASTGTPSGQDGPSSILVRVGRGDEAAFARLFAEFAPRLTAYFRRGGAPTSVAEDLAQDTMLAVWRKAARFDPGRGSAAAWIFTVARNLRIDALRREGRPTFPADDPVVVELPAAEAAFAAGEDRVRLLAALGRLPAEQARIIALSYYEERPHQAIAEQLGLPLGTVKSRLRLGIRRLRAAMGIVPNPGSGDSASWQ